MPNKGVNKWWSTRFSSELSGLIQYIYITLNYFVSPALSPFLEKVISFLVATERRFLDNIWEEDLLKGSVLIELSKEISVHGRVLHENCQSLSLPTNTEEE